jgi:hypothetical protein
MYRTLSVCALLLALPAAEGTSRVLTRVPGAATTPAAKGTPRVLTRVPGAATTIAARAGEPPATGETVIRLTLQAMPAPRPALKYQLLPELKEMNPGNPIQGYLKCFMEQNNFFHSKEGVAERERLVAAPLEELRGKDLHNYGSIALRQADYAARLDTPDWQTLLKLKSDGPRLLIPEVQQLRMLAQALKVRFRGEIADGRFDDAAASARTMFAMSRHLAEHPTLIGDLVGIAIAYITIGPLDEMIGSPGCPNLYWALTYLPEPLIDLHKGLQGERTVFMHEFALLDEQAPMSQAQLDKAQDEIVQLYKDIRLEAKLKPREWLAAQSKDEARVKAARKRLTEVGLAEERVKGFPAMQVVLLDEKREYEARRDDVMKGLMLPYWQYEPTLEDRAGKETEFLFGDLVAACQKVRNAQNRLQQRIALLRHVEAVRLYAAEHGGRPPAKLSDVKVPLPVDPFTGKPFIYKAEGQKVSIQGSPPRGEEKSVAYNIRYELTLVEGEGR